MSDTQLPDSWIAYCAAFHELFPRSGNVELSAAAIQQFACNLTSAKEAELASLRHDIERAVQRNTELLAENFELQSSFEDEVTKRERAEQLLLEAEDRSIQHLGAAIQEKAKRERAEAERDAAVKDSERLNALVENSWDLCCTDLPTGGGDSNIGWQVIGHYMQAPNERVIAEVFHDDPRAAIDAAIDAARKGQQ